jgi:hypothetical protein
MKLEDPVRFLQEVLAVLYGNLLVLYGDNNQAIKYFETLGSYDLHEELYGEILTPRHLAKDGNKN